MDTWGMRSRAVRRAEGSVLCCILAEMMFVVLLFDLDGEEGGILLEQCAYGNSQTKGWNLQFPRGC